jgi:hypothetical protein
LSWGSGSVGSPARRPSRSRTGRVVLTYDHKTEAEAKADAHMACLLLLGDRWSETVELVE